MKGMYDLYLSVDSVINRSGSLLVRFFDKKSSRLPSKSSGLITKLLFLVLDI